MKKITESISNICKTETLFTYQIIGVFVFVVLGLIVTL